MDPRTLAAASQENARAAAAALTHVSQARVDPTAGPLGAYPASSPAPPQPFFQDRTIVLSRPAHLRDYQGDAAAYPFRKGAPEELAPCPPPRDEPVITEAPRMVFTSEAEQKWLHEREAAARAAAAESATQAARAGRDFSQPPAPFVSKLGFREPAPMPPMPPPIKDFCHQDGVSKEFFWAGTGRFVSENGTANSQKYYSLARPLGGRLKGHTSTNVTGSGYHFEGPLSYMHQ